jgi:Glycosyl hydrolase family 12
VAFPNLYNVGVAQGAIRQCYDTNGVTTSVAIKGVSPKAAGPAGYPELGYGFDLQGRPFCDACGTEPFPLPIATLGNPDHDFQLTTSYSIESPRPDSLPVDLTYDFWVKQDRLPGRPPRGDDVEVLIFLYQRGMDRCVSSRSATGFSAEVTINGRVGPTTWHVCQLVGGTGATAIAFFLATPAQAATATFSLKPRTFIEEAGGFLKRNLGDYSLMGVELGGEFNQCSLPAGCVSSTVNWQWQIAHLLIEGIGAAVSSRTIA